eukprot:COSAG01_NODE_25879_length_730_cov_1.122029_1_plen_238_part_01
MSSPAGSAPGRRTACGSGYSPCYCSRRAAPPCLQFHRRRPRRSASSWEGGERKPSRPRPQPRRSCWRCSRGPRCGRSCHRCVRCRCDGAGRATEQRRRQRQQRQRAAFRAAPPPRFRVKCKRAGSARRRPITIDGAPRQGDAAGGGGGCREHGFTSNEAAALVGAVIHEHTGGGWEVHLRPDPLQLDLDFKLAIAGRDVRLLLHLHDAASRGACRRPGLRFVAAPAGVDGWASMCSCM